MADVLELVGIAKLTGSTNLGGRHVEFVSVDRCKVDIYKFDFFYVLLCIH